MRLVYLTLAWCAGILLAAGVGAISPSLWWIAALLATIALIVAWRSPDRRTLHALILMLAVGGLRFALTPTGDRVAIYNGHGGLTLEGVIADEPQPRSNGVRFRLAVDHVTHAGQTQTTSGTVLVESPSQVTLTYGDRVRATGDMFRPPQYDTFSYADFLARSGIFSLMPNAAVEVTDHDAASPLAAAMYAVKARARDQITAALPEPYAGLMMGILLGDESSIAPEVEDAFARTGAAHVIAISGFNMVVISGILIEVLKRLRLPRQRIAVIAISIVAIYTLFVGASASVTRAALMSGLLIVGELVVRRKTFVPASLAFAALVLSLLNPYVLWDVGFQLSLFATLGIVLFTDPMTNAMQRWLDRTLPTPSAQVVGAALGSTLIVSLAAQTLTLPLIALYFERVSIISLIVNVLIVPVQPAVLVFGGLATLVGFIVPVLGQVLYWAAMVPLGWTTAIVRTFAVLPFAEAAVQVPARAIAFLFVIVVGGAILNATQPDWLLRAREFVRKRATMVTSTIAALGLLTLTGALVASRPDGNLHVWLLTMGHSNAVLAQTPGGAQVLIDGGRFPASLLLALGDRMPFNDREIEILAITQPDEFDFSALPDVLARYPARLVLTNGQPNLGQAYAALETAYGDAEVIPVRAGYSFDLSDGTQLEVLSPPETPALGDPLDDGAMVLRLRYGDAVFLLASDISAEGQQVILSERKDVSATAFVLPQHGTARSLSDEFLRAVAPQIVLLQSDPANRLGDPDPDVLAQVEGFPLYRTDVSGTIHLWTDGAEIWIEQEGV